MLAGGVAHDLNNVLSGIVSYPEVIMPPGMNGRETYEIVNRIRPGQPAVIASGFSETDELNKAQRLGAGGLLKKPYAIDALGQALMTALASSACRDRIDASRGPTDLAVPIQGG